MAEPKKKMKGGLDPVEMARLSHERQRQNRAQQKEHSEKVEKVDVSALPRQRLIELLRDPRTRSTDVVAAAKALSTIPVDDDTTGWKASMQVRPDFQPPSWSEVLTVAKEAGAIEKKP